MPTVPSTKSNCSADDREAQLATTPLPAGCSLGVTWLDGAKHACEQLGVSLDDVLKGSRDRQKVRARARAWADLLDLRYSYPEIARGWLVDHSTVNAVVRVHEPEAWARRSEQYKLAAGRPRKPVAGAA